VTISGATQRIFQAGKAMHDALTARRAVQPSTPVHLRERDYLV
jgi:hypothetical protein